MPERCGWFWRKNRVANDVNRVRLALFFTRGVSLRTWDGIGLLDREVALYRKLAARLRRITFVTYGDRQDRTYHGRWGELGCNAIGGVCRHKHINDS